MAIRITSQPVNSTIFETQSTTFIVQARDDEYNDELTYSWQQFIAGQWETVYGNNYAGINTNTLRVNNAAISMNGYRFRCYITLSGFVPIYSNEVYLYVSPLPTFNITSQPTNTTVSEGQQSSFSVSVNVSSVSYQWESYIANQWEMLDDTDNYNGVTSNVFIIYNTNINMSGQKYRCIITSTVGSHKSQITNEVTLTVNSLQLQITTQPINTTYYKNTSVLYFTIAAVGYNVMYTWQNTPDGGFTWVNIVDTPINQQIPNTFSGSSTTKLTLTLPNIQQAVRCIVKDSHNNQIVSNIARATYSAPQILPPTNVVVTAPNSSYTIITWDTSNTEEENYQIEKGINGININDMFGFQPKSTFEISPGKFKYQDNDVEPKTLYSYRLRSNRTSDNTVSTYTGIYSITTPDLIVTDVYPPRNFSTITQWTNRINLNWELPIDTTIITHYEIQKKKSTDTNYSQLLTLNKSILQYDDYNVTSNTTYNYRIRSINTDDASITDPNSTTWHSDWLNLNATTLKELTIPVNVNIATSTAPQNSVIAKISGTGIDIDHDLDPVYGDLLPINIKCNPGSYMTIVFNYHIPSNNNIKFIGLTDGNIEILPTNNNVTIDETNNIVTITNISIPNNVSSYYLTIQYIDESKTTATMKIFSDSPNTGIHISVSKPDLNNKIEDYTVPSGIEFSYDIREDFYITADKTSANQYIFNKWINNNDPSSSFSNQYNTTIGITLNDDQSWTVKYKPIRNINAPSNVQLIGGYERIKLQWSNPIGGELPLKYKIYKRISETQLINTINTSDVAVIFANQFYYYDEVDNNTFIYYDNHIPVNLNRCYMISAVYTDDETEFIEIFSNSMCGVSNLTGEGLHIIEQPINQTLNIGDNLQLQVGVAGVTGNVTYQWYKNEILMDGKTSNILIINNIDVSYNNSSFYCLISDTITGDKLYSNDAIIKVLDINIPTNLVSYAYVNRIQLSWEDNSLNEAGFNIYYSENGSEYKLLATTSPNTVSYTHFGVTSGQKYWYKINSYIGSKISDYSNITTSVVPFQTVNAPKNLLSIPDIKQITLTWTDESYNETGFNIYYSENGVDFTKLSTVGAGITVYTHENLIPEKQYWYSISAFNTNSESYRTEVVSTKPKSDIIINDPISIAPPSNLLALGDLTGIYLLWTDDSINEAGFEIYRKINNSTIDFIQIDTVTSNITQYLDTTVDYDIEYQYKIKAYNNNIKSEYSNVAIGKKINQLITGEIVAPQNLTALADVRKNILKWVDMSTNEDGFKIYSSDDGNIFTLLDTIGASETIYIDSVNKEEFKRWYKITSYNSNIESSFSNTISSITLKENMNLVLGIPNNLTVVSNTTSLELYWADHSYNETAFEIWYSEDGIQFKYLDSVNTNVTFYFHENIPDVNKTYWYKVRSTIDSRIYSEFSNIESGTTIPFTILPSTPTNLITIPSDSKIDLYWKIFGDGIRGVHIFRSNNSSDDANFVKIATLYNVGQPLNRFTDYNLTNGNHWCYKVVVFNDEGESDPSNISCSIVNIQTSEQVGTVTVGGIPELSVATVDSSGKIISLNNTTQSSQKMSADWNMFTNILSSYFESKSSMGEKDTAKFIVDLYDSTIKFSTEQYGNHIISSNKNVLENYIYLALNDVKSGMSTNIIAEKLSRGVISYWSTLTLQSIIPPPGSVSGINNVVIFPGNPSTISIFNTLNSTDFANSLSMFFNNHSKSISGILTALVSTPGGLLPVPYQWIGFGS